MVPQTAQGVDEFSGYTFDANTRSYNIQTELLQFDINLNASATPEPGMPPVLGIGIAAVALLCVRRRKPRTA